MTAADAPVSIRPATPDDLPAIVAMRNDLNAHELAGCPHAPIQRLSREEFTALWGPTLASPAHCWRVVEAAGELIGFGLLYLVPSSKPTGAFVHWAYLAPPHRRRGLGRRLLDHLVAWARARGVHHVELQFIDGNEVAERFWTGLGFRPYARKCVWYLPDDARPAARPV